MPIGEDNSATEQNATSTRKLRSVRHIGVDLRFLQELVASKTIEVIRVPSKWNPADLMTKMPSKDTFQFLVKLLMHVEDGAT